MELRKYMRQWNNGGSAAEGPAVSGHYPQFSSDLESLSETDKRAVLARFENSKVAANYLESVYPGMINNVDTNNHGRISKKEFHYGYLFDISPITDGDRPVLTDSGILGCRVRKLVKKYGIPQRDTTVLLKTEKATYYRGEPVAFNVELHAGANLAGELLFQKNLENITFTTVVEGRSQKAVGTNRVLAKPTEFASAHAGETFRAKGVGRVSFPAGKTNKDLYVNAYFRGYQDPWRLTGYTGFRLRIKTASAEEAGKLTPKAAYKLFMKPVAQRFMYGLGDVQDVKGQQAMRSIVNDHPESVYAAYANLVLGLEQLAIKNTVAAKIYLDASNRDLLGPTFQGMLDNAKAQPAR